MLFIEIVSLIFDERFDLQHMDEKTKAKQEMAVVEMGENRASREIERQGRKSNKFLHAVVRNPLEETF